MHTHSICMYMCVGVPYLRRDQQKWLVLSEVRINKHLLQK